MRTHPLTAAQKRNPERRGSIAVIAMIAILITISIGLGLIRLALLEREQSLRWQNRKQAEWLVEAGVERAVAQLESSADYQGETWTLPAEQLGGRAAGQVVIEFERTSGTADRQQLTVVADYPADSEQRIRSRKVITITKP